MLHMHVYFNKHMPYFFENKCMYIIEIYITVIYLTLYLLTQMC